MSVCTCLCFCLKLESKCKDWSFQTDMWRDEVAWKSSPCTLRFTKKTLTHAAQMQSTGIGDRFFSYLEVLGLQRLPPAAGAEVSAHHQQSNESQQSQFTARTLLPASSGKLHFVVHSYRIPWFPSRRKTVKRCTAFSVTMLSVYYSFYMTRRNVVKCCVCLWWGKKGL